MIWILSIIEMIIKRIFSLFLIKFMLAWFWTSNNDNSIKTIIFSYSSFCNVWRMYVDALICIRNKKQNHMNMVVGNLHHIFIHLRIQFVLVLLMINLLFHCLKSLYLYICWSNKSKLIFLGKCVSLWLWGWFYL